VIARGGERQLIGRGKRWGTTNIGAIAICCMSRSGLLLLRRRRTSLLMVLVAGAMRMRVMRARGAGVSRYCGMVMKACRHRGRGQRLPR
jgi:hypothetical protein